MIDPGVLVSAIISPSGVPARIREAAETRRFELLASEKLLAELEDVLLRTKFRRYLSEDEAKSYTGRIRRSATVLPDPENVPRLTPDPKDDYLVTLARADYLVSGDPHLTELEDASPPVLTPRVFCSSARPDG